MPGTRSLIQRQTAADGQAVGLHRLQGGPFLAMLPHVVAPYPGTRPSPLHLSCDEKEIVPPQFALPHGAEPEILLVLVRFLVIAKMHEARMVEYLAHVADEIGADPVVSGRGKHA